MDVSSAQAHHTAIPLNGDRVKAIRLGWGKQSVPGMRVPVWESLAAIFLPPIFLFLPLNRPCTLVPP